jgi:hypothetical protein
MLYPEARVMTFVIVNQQYVISPIGMLVQYFMSSPWLQDTA